MFRAIDARHERAHYFHGFLTRAAAVIPPNAREASSTLPPDTTALYRPASHNARRCRSLARSLYRITYASEDTEEYSSGYF